MESINRRNFLKYFTGGLLGAGLVPMLGVRESIYMPPPDVKVYIPEMTKDDILKAFEIETTKPSNTKTALQQNEEYMKLFYQHNQKWLREWHE